MDKFLELLATKPNEIMFEQTMQVIDEHFDFNPVSFVNGETENQAGQNNGSCKIFAFAQIQGLGESSTLACFGQFYRDDVLKNPNGSDHANIRNFIQHGWAGIQFDGVALTEK
ncbi:HopJ type III effector protein [Vibrio methylphosphonaticus]|uniref:HopJ type III effector protein n=1 Tax=Vibrio methylphosphonaticus TaxID=2946866 RepID=UPI002029FB29|nr:HopJ type III effector protein [Vibrio methylphosphonaticus]MCL9775785.1 HopJ type III effector protein [Vibrio methylphosphonaticus]